MAWPRTTFWWTNSSAPRHRARIWQVRVISRRSERHGLLEKAGERRRKITPTNGSTMRAEIQLQLNPRDFVRFCRILRVSTDSTVSVSFSGFPTSSMIFPFQVHHEKLGIHEFQTLRRYGSPQRAASTKFLGGRKLTCRS